MKQSFFISLVLAGVVAAVFLNSPTANYQARLIFQNAIDRFGFTYEKEEGKKLDDVATIDAPQTKKMRTANRNRDLIDSLVSRGIISVDKQMFKVYVDSAFWNGMDYPAKNSFCTAVNNLYTGYPLVDKYSGKTLASSNRLGEINIME